MPPRHALLSQWLEMPYRSSGEIGRHSFRGPLHLRWWLGLRPEASETSLSFFSILNDSSKLMTVSRVVGGIAWTGNRKTSILPASAPPNTLGGLLCLCLQNDARLYLTLPCDDTVVLARTPDHFLAVAQLQVRLRETQRPSALMGSCFTA